MFHNYIPRLQRLSKYVEILDIVNVNIFKLLKYLLIKKCNPFQAPRITHLNHKNILGFGDFIKI